MVSREISRTSQQEIVEILICTFQTTIGDPKRRDFCVHIKLKIKLSEKEGLFEQDITSVLIQLTLVSV